jgi:tyrosinase
MFAIQNLLRFLLIPALSQSDAGSPGPPEDRSAPKCKSPTVRKEWRTLTSEQKENWISAFNVCIIMLCCASEAHWAGGVQCLTNLPRSGKLIPTVFPGDIPPLNVSGSWYDGVSLGCITPYLPQFDHRRPDFIYVHMDLNSHVISSCISFGCKLR